MTFADISLLSVFLGVMFSMILGGFWYSPLLFGNRWIKLMGFSSKDVKRMKDETGVKTYFAMFVSSFVLAYILAYFIGALGVVGFISGGLMGFKIWLGFIATVLIGSVLWEGKSIDLFWLNSIYWLVNLFVVGGILGIL
jgi:hypothetical protein